MGIVRFALRFPHTFYVLAALILFLGVTAIRTMPTDIFPQINIPVVTVIWQYTGLSTPEMEQRVTTYSQYSMSSNVTGIKNIEAQSLNGISVQKVYFTVQPGAKTAIHHHGEQETIAYVLKGECYVRWGERGEFSAVARQGSFIHVPAWLPHMEINQSLSSPFERVVVRSTAAPIVVNLPDDYWN
jgi:uncharacterized RmlC-like cupin family protein